MVESHAMIAGPANQEGPAEPHSLSMSGVGDVPKGSLVRTVTEEKSSFSVSGETSFESFSSSSAGGTLLCIRNALGQFSDSRNWPRGSEYVVVCCLSCRACLTRPQCLGTKP